MELNNTKPASHLHQLLIAHNRTLQITPKIEAHNHAKQITPKIEVHDPALQITPKISANNKAINLINTHAARVYKHVYYKSPAPRKLASNTTCNLNNLKYVDTASQNTFNTSLAQQNTSKSKQLFQIRNELALAPRETQIIQSKIPPIRRHSSNMFNSHRPKIKSALFASSHPTIQSYNFNSKNSLSSKSLSEINYINKISNIMPSKNRITRVRFNNPSRTANQQSSNQNATCPASQRSNSPGNYRTANQRQELSNKTRAASSPPITTPTSLAHSSNASTPLTPSPHVPLFEHIVSKIFNNSLIASLTSKDAVLNEVRDCILTNNESRPKALNPYIHSYWRDLHLRPGCVCIDEKVAIPNVLREAMTDDIQSSHQGTWGMICMATHCWWPYMHRELIVKATDCKPCTVIDKNLKSVIPAKQFNPHTPCV